MNTDDLIEALVARHRPVRPGWLVSTTIGVVFLGSAMAAAIMWPTLGFRGDLMSAFETGRIVAKYTFLLVALVIAGRLFVQMARPGGHLADRAIVYGLPLAFVAFAALVEICLFGMPTQAIFLGEQRNWAACIAFVPVLAIGPYAGLMYILRQSAPTDLPGAGFAAGVFAGTIAAIAYAAHCPCDMPVFVGFWYPLAFLASGLIGAKVAPRAARW